jgi:hypothetical protein
LSQKELRESEHLPNMTTVSRNDEKIMKTAMVRLEVGSQIEIREEDTPMAWTYTTP